MLHEDWTEVEWSGAWRLRHGVGLKFNTELFDVIKIRMSHEQAQTLATVMVQSLSDGSGSSQLNWKKYIDAAAKEGKSVGDWVAEKLNKALDPPMIRHDPPSPT